MAGAACASRIVVMKNFIDTQEFSCSELEELMGLIRLLKDADRDSAVPRCCTTARSE